MEKIALFGTSADPPTAGHKAILQWLAQHYDRVAVWVSDNPFKEHRTARQNREAMLRLIINELSNCSRVSLHEELSDRRSLHSVQKAQEIWGEEVEYVFVIGSDLAGQIRQWYQVEQLLQQVRLLIVPRPGSPVQESDLNALRLLGASYEVANIEVPAVSSTAYREEGNQDALTLSVQDYIRQEQLYS
ncbi:MAG: nicotinate-nucleotide adenylyltransferase [Cyanophyceae cyanobacterium]